MEKNKIIKILSQLRARKISIEDAFQMLRHLPYEELGFAKVDHHRFIRRGMPEVIFCQGKILKHILAIFDSLKKRNKTVLLTRADKEIFQAIKRLNPKAVYNELAQVISIQDRRVKKQGKVAVVCAGTADIPIAEEACVTAEIFDSHVERVYDVGVAGIHGLFDCLDCIKDSCCIIVLAGMDGVLPSVVGGLVHSPVIAVPTSVGYGANLGGITPLLTMLNSCAPNVSVVNINNGFGAGYIAALINRIKND